MNTSKISTWFRRKILRRPYKHLKVKAKLLPDKLTCDVVVIEQTHRAEEFGNVSLDVYCNGASIFKYKNVCICSSRLPSYYTSSIMAKHVLYVRGFLHSYDHVAVNVPVAYWPKLKEAIKAYNHYYR